MKPIWKVTANGTDITAACAKRLLSLTVTDEAGIASDTIVLTLDNRDLAIAAPRKGAKLECWMGYEEAGMVHMGLFVVDELAVSGPPHTLTINGKAANMRQDMKAQKTRGWSGITIGDLVKTIAAEHGLNPVVAPALASIAISNLAQTNENDMALLTRIAKTYDAVAKPMAGRLLFLPRGEAKSATGRSMPTVTLEPGDLRTYTATRADRSKFGRVVAQWHNPATGQPETLTVGSGEGPTLSIRQKYPDADQARRAALAKMNTLARGLGTFSGDVVPGRPSLGSGGKMVVSGLGDIASGTWVITRVVHRLDKSGGLTTRLDGEPPKGAAAG
jgi:phage protein D